MPDPSALSNADRQALHERIEAALTDHVRPELRAEGSDVELVGIDDDRIVQVRLSGACQGCSPIIYTLTTRIEAAVKAKVPEVRFVEAVL